MGSLTRRRLRSKVSSVPLEEVPVKLEQVTASSYVSSPTKIATSSQCSLRGSATYLEAGEGQQAVVEETYESLESLLGETPISYTEVPIQRGFACAKMMVRPGFRCACHFQRNCPAKLAVVAKEEVEGTKEKLSGGAANLLKRAWSLT